MTSYRLTLDVSVLLGKKIQQTANFS